MEMLRRMRGGEGEATHARSSASRRTAGEFRLAEAIATDMDP